jgi:uracil-DNA glycosylase
LPPPKVCADTWRKDAVDFIGNPRLTLLIGGYAQSWHLRGAGRVSDRVAGWRDFAPRVFPLPHPSWRNTGWLRRNPWFADELLPVLRAQVKEVLE